MSEEIGTPKKWKDMSPEEKGALLLADHEEKEIEIYLAKIDYTGEAQEYVWEPLIYPGFRDQCAYRVKPEPVAETVTSYWCPKWGMRLHNPVHDTTHRITFDLIDGKPDCDSVKMEEI